MNKPSTIYLAGHRGLVGSAIHRKLSEKGYTNLITRTSRELDLRDQKAVARFFAQEKPEYVILAAAKVGGIIANNKYRAEFLYDNIQIQNNVIHQSYLNGVKKLLFLGSSCIYPKDSPQPMKESYLLTDELEYTNEPYAIAKIAGMKMCEAYNIQYGTDFMAVMPTNLYGPNDNYDLETSHVLPALVRKMHLGKCLENDDWQAIRKDMDNQPVNGVDGKADQQTILNILSAQGIHYSNSPMNLFTKQHSNQSTNQPSDQSVNQQVTIHLWGSGRPRREFLHSDDMADACVYIMENIDFADLVKYSLPQEKQMEPITTLIKQAKESPYRSEDSSPIYSLVNDHKLQIKNTHINIGTGKDISIKELAAMIKEIVGFNGEITWNTDMPDGTYQKLLDVSKLNELGWKERIDLQEGIEKVYSQYQG